MCFCFLFISWNFSFFYSCRSYICINCDYLLDHKCSWYFCTTNFDYNVWKLKDICLDISRFRLFSKKQLTIWTNEICICLQANVQDFLCVIRHCFTALFVSKENSYLKNLLKRLIVIYNEIYIWNVQYDSIDSELFLNTIRRKQWKGKWDIVNTEKRKEIWMYFTFDKRQ